jgi:hypothetical protein
MTPLPYFGLGCGGRGRLLKLLICRVAGSRDEGYLLFAGMGIPQKLQAFASGPIVVASAKPPKSAEPRRNQQKRRA